MIRSTNKAYWTPRALYSAHQLAMASCLMDTNQPPTLPQVSAAIFSNLSLMAEELEPEELRDLGEQLELAHANAQEIANELMERSIVSQILADVNWSSQKPHQPPTKEIREEIEELTIWDYLDSAMVMR
mgnify:CR=1 FL=1